MLDDEAPPAHQQLPRPRGDEGSSTLFSSDDDRR
jgi:hypothetical protein